MGMYTGLRAKVIVKEQWRDAIFIATTFDKCWEDAYTNFPNMPGLKDWVKVGRNRFIPFGALAYMPEDFSEKSNREGYCEYDKDTGIWEFCCSLKNYEGEIQTFIDKILSKISEKYFYCESLYEEDAQTTEYVLCTQ